VKELSEKQEDNMKIIDLYRNAFETQLDRNRRIFVALLNKQLTPTATGNLLLESVGAIASGIGVNTKTKDGGATDSTSAVNSSYEQDYMLNIIDMLRDRTEEVFHKRLSAQFLADRIHQLEDELKQLKEKEKPKINKGFSIQQLQALGSGKNDSTAEEDSIEHQTSSLVTRPRLSADATRGASQPNIPITDSTRLTALAETASNNLLSSAPSLNASHDENEDRDELQHRSASSLTSS